MLQRLTVNNVSTWWPLLSEGLSKALLPTVLPNEESLSSILDALLQEKMQCWLDIAETEDGKHKVNGSVVTATIVDEFSNTKNLLIYSLYSEGTANAEDWKDALVILKRFAKGSGCYKIIAYTEKAMVESIVGKLGGKTTQTLVEFDLDDFE